MPDRADARYSRCGTESNISSGGNESLSWSSAQNYKMAFCNIVLTFSNSISVNSNLLHLSLVGVGIDGFEIVEGRFVPFTYHFCVPWCLLGTKNQIDERIEQM